MAVSQTTGAITVSTNTGGASCSRRRRTLEWKCEALRHSELFVASSVADVEFLARSAVVQRFRRGHIVQLSGDAAVGVYVVASGAIRLLRQNPVGREQVLSVERTGAVIGLAALFDGGPYFASMVADDDPTELLLIDKSIAERICRQSPELLCRVLRIVASHIRGYADLVDALALHDVDRRVAWFLMQHARDHSVPCGSVVTFDLTVTHRQIATRIGTVRERVTRGIARLQQEGLILVRGHTVAIPNREALAKFASG